MNVGLIGLGKMGIAIASRLLKAKFNVIAFDPNNLAQDEAKILGVQIAPNISEVAQKTRIIWLMVPAGKIVDVALEELRPHLRSKDIIIDGGNSKFSDSMVRGAQLSEEGVYFIDCGTSGGIHGREIGFSLMIGGDQTAYREAEPIFKAIAAPGGYGYMGPSGTGHYVKMIHNGIEYALLQAYAQGFHLLKFGRFGHLNLEEISRVWINGSIIRSWILELAHEVFKKDQDFKNITGEVEHTGMGAWMIEEAQQQKIPATLIEESLNIRKESQKTGGNYATKIVAMLRNAFGGHAIKQKK